MGETQKICSNVRNGRSFLWLVRALPTRRRSNVAALDILSINSTVMKEGSFLGSHTTILPRIGRVSLDNGETIRTGRRRTVFTRSNLKNTHREKT